VLNIKPPPGHEECDQCDGYGNAGFDECGAPFACYRCGMSGWIPVGLREQEAREAAEYQRTAPTRWEPATRSNPPSIREPLGNPAGVWNTDDDIPF
jgi:hypothetical protein